ncbi:MAG TPA: antitoxin MazE-like protein [Bryobacteraceae bacterium]|nr:antitoxin MazE-like protein [Bryobacteraceae bacterium]
MPRVTSGVAASRSRRTPSPRKGMRLHKIWLPDTDSPSFRRQARRESLAAARSAETTELQTWMDSVSVLPLLPEHRDDL